MSNGFKPGDWRKPLTGILLVLLVLAITSTIYIILNPKPGEAFTEFYVLGPGGEAADYPTNMSTDEEGIVILGIVNHEHETTSYHVIAELQGERIWEEQVTLQDKEEWQREFNFTPKETGDHQKLEFKLYKDNTNETPMTLHLWINVHPDT